GFGHPSSPRGRPVTPGNRRRAVTDTTCEEEPMASRRPYERLLQQAQRLTQRDEYWAGTTRLARMWVTPKKAPPYRPYKTLGLVSIPSVTPEQLGQLYHLAAQFYQASPWAWFHDHHPFAITCPPEDSPRYAIVMGSGGEVFGLAVYDRLADLRSMFVPPGLPRQRARRCTWSVLFFEAAPAVCFVYLDAESANDMPVSAPIAYPVFGRTS